MPAEISKIRSNVDDVIVVLADVVTKLHILDQRMNTLDEQDYSPSADAEISSLRQEVAGLRRENALLTQQVVTCNESLAHAIATQETLRLAARNLQKQR